MENIKTIVARVLLENGIKELPVDVMQLRLPKKKWIIKPFSQICDLLDIYKAEGLVDNPDSLKGFATKSLNGNHYIFYNDNLSYSERIQVIAHEIGHIVLEHTSVGIILGKSNDPAIEDMQEKEANIFADYILGPLCILADDGIYDPDTISKVTLVSPEHATAIAAEVQRYKRTRRSKTERELSKKFNTKRYRRERLIKKVALIGSALAVTTALAFGGRSLADNRRNAESAQAQSETLVYITQTGSKFHRPSCSSVVGRDNLLAVTIDDAVTAGYLPCNVCNPLLE